MKIPFTKIVFASLMLLGVTAAKAQQDPHYSQFMHNKLWFNAGFAGATDGKICVSLLNRNQWLGFGGKTVNDLPQGDPPSNLVGTINASLGKSQRFGLGATIVNDRLGFEQTLIFRGAFSYRQPIGTGGNLGIGVGVGNMQRSLDGSQLKAIDPDDPTIPTGIVSGSAMDLDFGLYYTQANLLGLVDNFYAGLSATHLNQNKIGYESPKGTTYVDSKLHYYFVTGADYQMSNFVLNPNILIKKDPGKIQADLNCMAIFNQSVSAGLTWRPFDAVVLLGGYTFNKIPLMVGYSYDLTTTRIINYSTGSHEIMLRYCFGVKIPRSEPIIRSRYTPRFM
jgi:type IX secretion system PorP/SprF family membrane protein